MSDRADDYEAQRALTLLFLRQGRMPTSTGLVAVSPEVAGVMQAEITGGRSFIDGEEVPEQIYQAEPLTRTL